MAIPRQAIAGLVGGSGPSLPHHQDDKYRIGYAVRSTIKALLSARALQPQRCRGAKQQQP